MKTSLDSAYKTNDEAAKNGLWFEASPGIAFLLRQYNATNPRVKAALAAYYKPYARQVDMGTLDPAKEREIQIKLFVDVCLVDWKGVEIDGKVAECTKEVAIKLFTALPELYETLHRHSSDFANYKEDLGNS